MEKRFNLKLNSGNCVIWRDDSCVYKTDAFFKETAFLISCDEILEILGGVIGENIEDVLALSGNGSSFECDLGVCSFLFTLSGKNPVFFGFKGREIHRNDRRLASLSSGFEINIHRVNAEPDLSKLYTLSFEEGVSFPRLTDVQKEIVEKEDGNVLVQGVAGSGKTNICIDKIIFAASEGYTGKVLYSTYSRGLLIDTENRVRIFKKRIEKFLERYAENRINIKGDFEKAIALHLGINHIGKDTYKENLEGIISYLEKNVDYFLLIDIYREKEKEQIETADENTFLNEYLPNLRNYRLSVQYDKIKYLDGEIIYKEIYGMIFGSSDEKLSVEKYTERRKGSFSKEECEIIFALAQDYSKFLYERNFADNNIISRLLMNKEFEPYSLVILDEVQDFTEINLLFLKKISRKMLCVGDALQMINPSYFSFSFLKKLMYEKDVTGVRELKHNYRNTKKLESIIDSLNEINTDRFGTHSFVLKGESVDTSSDTVAVYTDYDFISGLKKADLSNCTLVTSSKRKKEELRTLFDKAEIFTVSEIKGLERDNIVLIDILSDNSSKWERLYKDKLNRKVQDENSTYRYYFNLFYVGISRSRHNLYVEERKKVSLFEDFFKNNFKQEKGLEAASSLQMLIGTGREDEEEIIRRVNEFINLSQFDNAYFALRSLSDEKEAKLQTKRIDIYKNFVEKGDYKGAGIAFWEAGVLSEAKKFFELSGNDNLSKLVDACSGENTKLDASIVLFYEDLKDNETAVSLIMDTLKKETESIKEENREILKRLKQINKR